MREKRISPLHQRLYTSCSDFCADRSKSIIQPVPLLTIECLRSAGSHQYSARFIHQNLHERTPTQMPPSS